MTDTVSFRFTFFAFIFCFPSFFLMQHVPFWKAVIGAVISFFSFVNIGGGGPYLCTRIPVTLFPLF